jgi:hypothetical protein
MARMKRDRFLISILIGILILVAAALTLYLLQRNKQGYISEDLPAGVVHNYILAIDREDYERAYGYLADLSDKPTYEKFLITFSPGWTDADYRQGIEIGETKINGNQAIVELHILSDSLDPFYSGSQNADRALLVRQNGVWKLKEMPWGYWEWNWYH